MSKGKKRSVILFFFNDTATTEIYTLSLHDALPIWPRDTERVPPRLRNRRSPRRTPPRRSEEHTSELQSRLQIVCRLLLEKKNKLPAVAGHRPAASGGRHLGPVDGQA